MWGYRVQWETVPCFVVSSNRGRGITKEKVVSWRRVGKGRGRESSSVCFKWNVRSLTPSLIAGQVDSYEATKPIPRRCRGLNCVYNNSCTLSRNDKIIKKLLLLAKMESSI